MITKEKVLKVVARLKTVEKLANKKGGFNMSEPEVDFNKEGHPCGTTHCLAGWYTVACYKRPFIKKRKRIKEKHSCKYFFGYKDGTALMAKDLGFYSENSFLVWLNKHKKEWGNDKGYLIFGDELAFNYSGFSGAIKHLEEFAGRLI